LIKPSGRDWTKDFYSVQSTIVQKRGTDQLDTIEVMDRLTDMTAKFTEDAVTYGSIIIKEQNLPINQKTIKPIGVGGVAGGQKFVHEGIFFKFPTNEANLYGNLENAMRGAGHELKGLTGLINWELKSIGLHTIKFPLTAIIDFYGYRLVATAVLPLSSKTLVIGSGDAGKTVLDGSENNRTQAKRLASLLEDYGKFLNLAPHDFLPGGSFSRRTVKVSICFDLEGHIGTDGNYYMCDFARTFPPADPLGVPGRFLYRLLRPEYVKKYRTSLSSDSFLKMQVDKQLTETTREASKHLTTTWLIEAIRVWNRSMNCVPPPGVISLLLHQSGINMRYLRLVAAVVMDESLKKMVHAEIVARSLKSVIRNEIRESNKLDGDNVKSIITKYLNLIFSDNDESNDYWDRQLQLEILNSSHGTRFDAPTAAFFDAADEILSAPTPASSPAPSLHNSSVSVGRTSSPMGSQSLDSPSASPPASPSLSRSRSSTKKASAKKTTVRGSKDEAPKEKTPKTAKRTGPRKRSAASTPTSSQEVNSLSTSLEIPVSSTGPRRSTRVRQVRQVQPEEIPGWLTDNIEGDELYNPSSSEEEVSLGSSSSDDEILPDRYAVAYGDEDPFGDGEEINDDDEHGYSGFTRKSTYKSTGASKTRSNRKPSSNSKPSTPSSSQDLPRSSTPQPSLAPSSSFSGHTVGTLPTGVRLDRGLGIMRNKVNLEALASRLLELLGCVLGQSGMVKLHAVFLHHKMDVKPLTLADGTVVSASSELGLIPADLLDFQPRIKQLFLGPFQTAFRLKTRADETEDFDEREELLKLATDAYLECLQRNPLGDFALHNAARVLQAWLPFFQSSNNEEKCIAYLAKRFAFLAESQNKDLAGFKADIYKTSDLIEPRTSRVITKVAPEWCPESTIKRIVLLKTELFDIVNDIKSSGDLESDVEVRIVLRESYDQLFDEFAVLYPPKGKKQEKKVERKVVLQVWKMIQLVIAPAQPEKLQQLSNALRSLPKESAFLTQQHWASAAELLF
jgi:hypothetical protein